MFDGKTRLSKRKLEKMTRDDLNGIRSAEIKIIRKPVTVRLRIIVLILGFHEQKLFAVGKDFQHSVSRGKQPILVASLL